MLRQRNHPTVDWKADFLAFVPMVETLDESGTRVRLWPREFQARFESARTMRDIVLKPRQIGMTTWELARDIWFLLTRPGAQVVVVVQSMSDDSALRGVSAKAKIMFDSLAPFGVASGVEQISLSQWDIPSRNASLRIIGAGASEVAASKKARGITIHRLHITEIAFFEFARDTLNAMLEGVPDRKYGSEITIESTPNGASGLFFELYNAAKDGVTGYQQHFYPWITIEKYRSTLEIDERITPSTPRERELAEKYAATSEQIKWYRAKVAEKGQDLADQEYPIDEETCWLSEGRQFFDKVRTTELLAAAVPPIETRQVGKEGSHGVLRIWVRPQPGRRYIIAVDPSEGVGGDPGAAVVLDRGTGEHVATVHGQFSTWEMARVVAELGKLYSIALNGGRESALVAVERNNHGHAVLQGLVREQKYTHLFIGSDKRPGWVNSEVTRAAALAAIHNAHRERHWSSPERESIAEMLRFVVSDSGKPEAAKGAHDDLVLAHAIGWDVACRPNVHRSVASEFVP